MGDFFGGGGGDPDITQASLLTGGQRSLLDLLTDLLQGEVGQGVTPFQGQRVAGISPLQQQGFGLAGGLAPGIGAGLDLFGQSISQFDPAQGQGILGGALSSLQGATQQFDPQSILGALEPGRQLALNTFSQDIIPQLSEKFGATSGASGAFNKALSEAGANLSLGVSAQALPFLFQGQQSQLDRQLQGAGLQGSFAQLPGILAGQGTALGAQSTDLLSQLINIGGVQRGIEQQELTAEQQQFLEGEAFNNPFLRNFLGTALGTPAFENIVQPQGQGLGSALLPGLGSFLGGGGLQQFAGLFGGSAATGAGASTIGPGLTPFQASIFSDIRVKENIHPIEHALDKVKQLSGSTYNYKFNVTNNRNGGIMAQDLEQVLPDAVSEINGIKFVRYDAVLALLVNAVNELARKVG